jgi:hypothetical protein
MKICSSEEEYIEAIASSAQKACKRYGYLPSVLIAQSCLENGYGIRDYWDNPQIEALMTYNNMVGIKTNLLSKTWADKTVWPGESLRKKTPETYNGKNVIVDDDFRKYDNIEQSFADFLLFIKYASTSVGGKPKYGDAVLSIKDPKQLIEAVHSRGYATGPTYASNVMRILDKHKLTKYDDLSKVTPTIYTPGYRKPVEKKVIKLQPVPITDITKRNKGQVPRSRGDNPIEFITIHYLGVPNADNPDLYGGGFGGHYNIQRNGQVFKAADPRTAVVWHCGGDLQGPGGHTFFRICTNFNSIGIECGVCYTENVKEGDGDSNKWYFTEETQKSLVYLVSKLMDEYNISIDHVIRHYDVTGKICPNPYVKNNNLKTSWTWTQFKDNLAQYRKNGTITIPGSGSTSTDNTKAANTFLKAVKAVADKAKKEGWHYGDSHATPPCSDKTISCDRIVARALYDLGYTDQRKGGITCNDMPTWLNAHGFIGTTKKSKIKAGAVVAVGQTLDSIEHVFVVESYNAKTDMCRKYDTGSDARIKHGAYYTNVKLCEWSNRKFLAAWNVPVDLKGQEQPKPAPAPKPSGTVWNGVDYKPVYNYTYYRKKYPDLRKVFGTDKAAYFKHFVTYGMKECRIASASFNVVKYKNRYSDLRKAFGDNMPEYYKHYCIFGKKEGRNAK